MPGVMRNVNLDRRSPLSLYEQVAAEIRRAIADGEAKPGERLPPAKDLAHVLGCNTSTVLRALRQLRDEGLLEFRRGRGITVTGTPTQSALVEQAKELLHYARKHGFFYQLRLVWHVRSRRPFPLPARQQRWLHRSSPLDAANGLFTTRAWRTMALCRVTVSSL